MYVLFAMIYPLDGDQKDWRKHRICGATDVQALHEVPRDVAKVAPSTRAMHYELKT